MADSFVIRVVINGVISVYFGVFQCVKGSERPSERRGLAICLNITKDTPRTPKNHCFRHVCHVKTSVGKHVVVKLSKLSENTEITTFRGVSCGHVRTTTFVHFRTRWISTRFAQTVKN